jgi:hypothetical protein
MHNIVGDTGQFGHPTLTSMRAIYLAVYSEGPNLRNTSFKKVWVGFLQAPLALEILNSKYKRYMKIAGSSVKSKWPRPVS